MNWKLKKKKHFTSFLFRFLINIFVVIPFLFFLISKQRLAFGSHRPFCIKNAKFISVMLLLEKRKTDRRIYCYSFLYICSLFVWFVAPKRSQAQCMHNDYMLTIYVRIVKGQTKRIYISHLWSCRFSSYLFFVLLLLLLLLYFSYACTGYACWWCTWR